MNSLVFSQLNLFFMHDYQKAIMTLMKQISNNEFGTDPEDAENAIRLFQNLLTDLTKAQRRSKQENRFNLTDKDHFNAMMLEAADRALSTSHYLQTGWQAMNNMLNGGFEDARLYNFIGATGGFKSGLLLNIMRQIKVYNKGRPHKDPTKRPTILFLSQENNIWETFLRIFGIFGRPEDIKKYKPREIIKILKEGGFTTVNDDLDIDIEFRYYGNMDIGVPDIKGIVEELDNDGREVIIVIQDYIERLRPPVMGTEKRNQLFDISNQMHDLAIELDIPIITASQFNKEGVSIIEETRTKGKKEDIGRKVGTGNISESFGMLKNFDVNIGIVVEYDSNDERYYLSFRRLKFRGDDSNSLDYFLQPFAGKNSKIRLMDDISTEPLYRTSMIDEVAADIHNDLNEIDEITRRSVDLLESVTENPDDVQSTKFINKVFDDIKKSKADQHDIMPRDENGFIVLIRKDKNLDIRGLNAFNITA